MYCPTCNSTNTQVIDVFQRTARRNGVVYKRDVANAECTDCGQEFKREIDNSLN